MVDIAAKIIDQLEGPFDPSQFNDRYEDALRALIKEKEKGHKVKAPEEPKEAEVIDLMEALKRSLGQSGGERRKTAAAQGGGQEGLHRAAARSRRQEAGRLPPQLGDSRAAVWVGGGEGRQPALHSLIATPSPVLLRLRGTTATSPRLHSRAGLQEVFARLRALGAELDLGLGRRRRTSARPSRRRYPDRPILMKAAQ